MKITKFQFTVYVILLGFVCLGIILGMVNSFNEYNENYEKKFKELGGCKECGDVLVSCKDGSYDLVKNDKEKVKVICGEEIIMPDNQ